MATRVFLTDFGLARDTATGSRYTRTGTTLGTPAYMSPEQARGELPALTPATDVWSLGCVLYECVAGRRAFDGETDAAVVGQVLLAEPRQLASVAPQISRGLDVVVRACLAKRAGARYRDCAALRDDLDRVRRDDRPQARIRGPWRWKAAAAALAVAAAATLVALGWHKTEPGASAPPSAAAAAAESLAAQAKQLRTADPRQAADLLRRALDLTPSRDDWRLERGLLLWAIGEGQAARRLWSEIRPESRETTTGRLYRGLEAFFRFEEGRLHGHEAVPDLRAIAVVPGREGRLANAVLAAIEERWPQARRSLRDDAEWESALLRGYVEDVDPAGDRGAAVREYTRGLDEGIAFAWVLHNRGAARKAKGDVAGAIEDYGKALQADPRLAIAWCNRGVARAAQGDLAGAIEDYDKAVEINPRYADAWCNRGLARRVQGDLAGAIEDYGKALEANPELVPAWNNRGLARQAQGDVAGAIEDFGTALELDPGDAEAWNDLGVARQSQGDLAGAIEDYGRALQADPKLEIAWCNRGNALQSQGKLAGAIADLEQALAVAPPAWPHRKTVEEALARARAALAARGGK